VFNLDLFKEREEFRGSLIKLIILMLLHNVRKDFKNLCGKVVLYTTRKGYSTFEKMKLRKRNKLV
jgi:hypothetical protein